MARENMFDERETEPGPPLRATVCDIHTVESLRQARDVLGRDARAVVPYPDHRLFLASWASLACERDIDPLAGGAIFQRVLDQVLENSNELVAIATYHERSRLLSDADLHPTVAREGLQAVGDLPYDGYNINGGRRLQVCLQLDPRERQQIVDQARHAVRLRLHDAEKAFPGLDVVARRTLQRFDEARQ